MISKMCLVPVAWLLASGGVTAETTAPVVSITYELERSAQVSMLVAAEDGRVVRELLHAAPREKGNRVESWDGLDDNGKPVPAGAYRWRLLATPGLKAEYRMTIGTNPKPKWEGWPGNHGGISAVAADAGALYIATGCGEATCLCVKQDYDGNRIWTIPHWYDAWRGPSAMALDASGGVLYMLHNNGKFYLVNSTSKEWMCPPQDVGFDEDRKRSWHQNVGLIMDMDAAVGQVVVSYTCHDLIRWLNPTNGTVIDDASVPKPFGVAVDSDGSVLVISDGDVVRLTRAEKEPRVVIPATELSGPWRLAVDPVSHEILVAEHAGQRGFVDMQYFGVKPAKVLEALGGKLPVVIPDKPGCQIKRFSKDGKRLATYGTPEGRVVGPYDPATFGSLEDIAVTKDGGFLSAEDGGIRRTALFDKTGKLQREWYGGWWHSVEALVDPLDATDVWFGQVRVKVDYAAGTFRVVETIEPYDLFRQFGQEAQGWVIRRRGDATYWCRIGGSMQGMACGPAVIRQDAKRYRQIPAVVADSNLLHNNSGTNHPVLGPLIAQRRANQQPCNRWMWCDLNGDGELQTNEVTFTSPSTYCWGWYIDEDFTYYVQSDSGDGKRSEIMKWPVRRWTEAGVPVYDWSDFKPMAVNEPGAAYAMRTDETGNVYRVHNGGISDPGPGAFGYGWWGSRTGVNRVDKWDKTGKRLWTVGRHAPGIKAQPGEGKYLWKVAGLANGCLAVIDADDSLIHVWDADGLWVGRMFDRPVIGTDTPLDAYRQCYENFSGTFFKDQKTGDVLYIGSAGNCMPVYKITGWDGWQRAQGAVRISPETALALQAKVKEERQGVGGVIRIPHLGAFNVDGSLKEWRDQKIEPIEIKDGERVLARVYLGWLKTDLCAAFAVEADDAGDLLDGGESSAGDGFWKSWSSPSLAFQGGAAVDVRFGPLAPNRKAAVEGDVRFVAAPVGPGGKTVAVEFMPQLLPGMKDSERAPATYKTGIGEITFARVAERPAGSAAAAPKPSAGPGEAAAAGYIVEMRCPIREPLRAGPGERFRLDLSVILADIAGKRTGARVPWRSRDSGDMATGDVYTEALLRPQTWGIAVLE